MPRADYWTVATRWVDYHLGRDVKLTTSKSNDRMYPGQGGDVLYSYGSHFTLVRALKDKKGDTVAFLLNGDRYSNTTSKHQSHVRGAVQRCGLPSVIIPFSALSAADIDDSTVEILDVLPDRLVERTRTYTEMQPSWRWHQVPVRSSRPQTPQELEQRLYAKNVQAAEEHHRRVQCAFDQKYAEEGKWPSWRGDYSEYLPGGPLYERKPVTVDDLGYWDTHDVEFIECYYPRLHTSGHPHAPEVEIIEVGGEVVEYRVTTRRHWLGESLIRAKVHYTTLHRCKECGGRGTWPFGPDYTPNWWGEFDPNDEWHRDRAIRWVAQMAACRTCSGRGRVSRRHQRVAHFLSGFDHNETRNLYFFSELPTRKSTTVEEAYEELKPDTVKIAEQMGREIQRQGDIFAVPLPDLDKRSLRQMGATFEKGDYLLGTNHRATEVARLKDGRTLARGTLTHDPGFRGPDHKRVSLPKGVWHLTVKNTVPIGK